MYGTDPESEDWYTTLLSRFAVASISSQGTIGGLLVSGFVSNILNNKNILKYKNIKI